MLVQDASADALSSSPDAARPMLVKITANDHKPPLCEAACWSLSKTSRASGRQRTVSVSDPSRSRWQA